MITQSSFRKVFEGVATRAQMFQMFDRHGQAPMMWSATALLR